LSNFREDLYRPEGEFQADPADEEPVKRRGAILAVCLLLALIGGGSAFLWHYYGSSITGPAASKTDAMSQLTVTLERLQQYQQGIAAARAAKSRNASSPTGRHQAIVRGDHAAGLQAGFTSGHRARGESGRELGTAPSAG